MGLTSEKLEPKSSSVGSDIVSRVNPKYHFPGDLTKLEHLLRICLGLPFKGKTGGTTAYGYIYDTATDTYVPQSELFKLLWEARRYLYTSSLREVADWLNFKAAKIGFTQRISHMGLRHLMVLRPPYEECILSVVEREKILESICLKNSLR